MANRTTRLQTFDVFSNKRLIQPTWLKVTRTPWDEGHNASGGYDRPTNRTSISHDSPEFFHIPAVYHANPSNTFVTAPHKGEIWAPQGRENSHDAPDWFNTTKSLRPHQTEHVGRGLTHHKLLVGHQVICEPKKRHLYAGTSERR